MRNLTDRPIALPTDSTTVDLESRVYLAPLETLIVSIPDPSAKVVWDDCWCD